VALPLVAYAPTLYLDARHPNGEGVTPPTHGTAVDTWTDLSGNGHNVTQATSSRQPVYLAVSGEAGGVPAMRFDGVDDFFEVLGLPQSATITVYAVFQNVEPVSWRVIAGRAHEAGVWVNPFNRWGLAENGLTIEMRRSGSSTLTATATQTNAEHTTRAAYTGAFNTLSLRRNGTSKIAAQATASITYPNGDTPLRLGANAINGEVLNGTISALLVFPVVHTATQQSEIETELTAFAVPPRTAVALTPLTASAWAVTAATSPTNITPAYPANLAEGDTVYTTVHSKPSTVLMTTPANWRQVSTVVAATSAAQGAGTGPTRITTFQRTVPAGGLTGTQAFTWTGTMSVAQASMNAYRPPAGSTNVVFEEVMGGWSVPTSGTTGQTSIGGSVAGLTPANLDHLLVTLGITDDDTTTTSITGVSATGATFGTVTASPALSVTGNGNDMATASYQVPVTGGSSTASVAITATQNVTNTMVGAVLRVRATVPATGAASSLPLAPTGYARLRPLLVR
jgi:hypothetical protein